MGCFKRMTHEHFSWDIHLTGGAVDRANDSAKDHDLPEVKARTLFQRHVLCIYF